MIKILLSGCNGKMGQFITQKAGEDAGCQIVAGVDINPVKLNSYPVFASFAPVTEKPDVIIDFSHPSALTNLLSFAVERKIPTVVATTGMAKEQVTQIREAAGEIPVFFSANMSLGVNLIMDLVCRAAKVLESDFDIEIIEKHHNQKVDAPSGTALAIADAISASLSYAPEYVYDRHSSRKKRSPREIGLHAVRGGTIVGEHTVLFAGRDEVIEIKHAAASKEVFAVGAVRAAKFIAGKPKGLYSMKDLVNS